MESIMLLIYVNFSMNNIRRDWIKNSLEKDLHSLYEAGNPPTTLLLGDDHPNKIREAKESSKLTSHTLSQLPQYTRYQKPEWGQSSKECFVTGQHRARHRPQYQNNRQKKYSCFRKCGWRKNFHQCDRKKAVTSEIFPQSGKIFWETKIFYKVRKKL